MTRAILTPIERARQAMAAAGVSSADALIVTDGKLRRFSTNGDPHDDSGWYVFFDSAGIVTGAFGDWRTGLKQNYCEKRVKEMTADEQIEYRKVIEAARQEGEAEESKRHAEAAERARRLWDEAQPAKDTHPYLIRKGIKPHGARIYRGSLVIRGVAVDGALLIPARDATGRLWTLEFILSDGTKRFFPGGRKCGNFFTIGILNESTTTVASAEGFATGASVHEATGLPVVVAFDAGNLKPVAITIKAKQPATTIVICGDNDLNGTGQAKAKETADAVGGALILPDKAGTDFNDMAQSNGLDAVRLCIYAVVTANPHILDEVHAYLGRFVSYPSEHAHVAHTLWVAHTHLMDVWESTPRIAFLSPEPGSGKTRALEITETLVPYPVEAINVTPAYLFRKISDPKGRPTILFDEIDTLFGPRAREHEEIRGVLNAGHRRGGKVGRCVIKGKEILTEELPAFSAVAMAGLGNLPDTILTRSIIVHMRRRAPDEHVEPYRRRVHSPKGHQLRDRLVRWANEHEANLNLYPVMPEGVTDRSADVWESLFSIADAAEGTWPDRARVAAVTLVTDAKGTDPSLGVRLLKDLRVVFGGREVASTKDLLSELTEMEESPWGDLKGKPLDGRRLARMLRPYEIAPKTVRIESSVVKGYARADFKDAWNRYLPPEVSSLEDLPRYGSVTSVTSKIEPHLEEETIYVD